MPENVLYRSRIEICRILRTLAKNRSSIYAEIGGSWTFVTHILAVDSRKGYFIISYCANKLLNSKLLKLSSLKFTASHRDVHFVFEVSNPTETRFAVQPAIQFALPNMLILYHRRESPRLPVPAEASLRCIADAGGIAPFESHITDITHDGFGCILYDCDIKLEPGVVLKGCRIIIPGGKAVIADLELRYIMTIPLSDGTLANRAGLRFIQRPDEIAELINFFIRNLDNNPDILKL
ncbi:MAG: flagellar brake protein [Gallionella sp.]|nr:flagellar brake protein [Gallionella sp.]